jgi:hypothetical protein
MLALEKPDTAGTLEPGHRLGDGRLHHVVALGSAGHACKVDTGDEYLEISHLHYCL